MNTNISEAVLRCSKPKNDETNSKLLPVICTRQSCKKSGMFTRNPRFFLFFRGIQKKLHLHDCAPFSGTASYRLWKAYIRLPIQASDRLETPLQPIATKKPAAIPDFTQLLLQVADPSNDQHRRSRSIFVASRCPHEGCAEHEQSTNSNDQRGRCRAPKSTRGIECSDNCPPSVTVVGFSQIRRYSVPGVNKIRSPREIRLRINISDAWTVPARSGAGPWSSRYVGQASSRWLRLLPSLAS